VKNKYVIVSTLIIFNVLGLLGQSNIPGLILTKEQSDKWIVVVKISSMKRRFELARERIFVDTNVVIWLEFS
jgi:hypothetical protein